MKKIPSSTALISYWIFKLSVFPLAILPISWRWRIGKFLGFLWWDVFRIRRYTVFRNLRIVFPNQKKEERKRFARLALGHLGFQFIEFLRLPWLSQKDLNRACFHGLEHLQAKGGKAPYILSLHMGPGDLALNLLCMKGIKLSLISKEFRNVWVNQFWFFVRNQKGLNFIPPHGKESAFKILKEPLEGRSVIFVLDQYMGPPFGIPTKFFGRETGTAYGLALFVKKTKIPVVPVYAYYDKEFRLHIVAAPPLEVQALGEKISLQTANIQDCQGIYGEAHLKRRRGQEEDWIRAFIDECNRRLEEIILKRPEQWMWVHRRWKQWG